MAAEPPFLRPVPRVPSGADEASRNTTSPAALALHSQLIDPAAETRGDVDPLSHLEPTRLVTQPLGAAPLTPSRGTSLGDDDLADLFNDNIEAAMAPSPLDPERKLPDDPLRLLQQPAEGFDRPVGVSHRAAAPPRLDADAPPTEMRAPLIPEDWDPGLKDRPRSPPTLPVQRALLNTARVLPLPQQRPADPTAQGDELPPLVAATSNGPQPLDDGVDQALTLLRRREAARGTAPPVRAAAPVGGNPDAVASASDAADELATLWQALGIDASRMSETDRRRLLVEIGGTIREIADGLIQILAARQHLKSEFRVDQTVLRPTENNLFKFTRNADELLSLAMSNRNRVFLAMDQAAREALNDIKAHEMATLAAVQLAIRAVLDRFEPDKLARQAAQQASGRFDRLKLRSANARCWSFFKSMFANLAADADEASNRIFTAEFGRAYRERVEKRPGR
jgi:type VI secretion system FHA domain protein